MVLHRKFPKKSNNYLYHYLTWLFSPQLASKKNQFKTQEPFTVHRSCPTKGQPRVVRPEVVGSCLPGSGRCLLGRVPCQNPFKGKKVTRYVRAAEGDPDDIAVTAVYPCF